MWDLVIMVVGDSLPAVPCQTAKPQAMGCQATHALNKSPEARRRQSSYPLTGSIVRTQYIVAGLTSSQLWVI
jgi:hypothetical protein